MIEKRKTRRQQINIEYFHSLSLWQILVLTKNYDSHIYSRKKTPVALYKSVMIQFEKPHITALQTSIQVRSLTKNKIKL